MEMRAVVTQGRSVRRGRVTVPEPRPGEVLIRVEVAGVCPYVPSFESLEFLTRHDLADLLGEPHPLEDLADVFAADLGNRRKNFLSPCPGDANWAPSRHIAR